jgi:hypothetical protein
LTPDENGTYLRVNVELPDDFSMDQVLSLYLLDTILLLDPEAPDYPLDLITRIESILEDPDMILRKQLDKLKGEAVARMKQAGGPSAEERRGLRGTPPHRRRAGYRCSGPPRTARDPARPAGPGP